MEACIGRGVLRGKRMNYFDRRYTGGSVGRKGFVYQDFVTMIYMFRHLSNPHFESISIEGKDDFILHFGHYEPDIYVQVKMHQLSFARICRLMEDTQDDVAVVQCYVGSSLNDELRNFLYKMNQLNSIQDADERVQAEHDLQMFCEKKNVDYDRFRQIIIDWIGEKDVVKIAQAEVINWAEEQNLFVDSRTIVGKLVERIHCELAPKRGCLTREEFIGFMNQNKASKIVSTFMPDKPSLLIQRFIEDIEVAIREHSRDRAELQTVKLLVEREQLAECKNMIESLFRENPIYLNLQMWSLLFQGEYHKIIKLDQNILCNTGNIPLICAWAFYAMKDYVHAVQRLSDTLHNPKVYEESLLMGLCFAELNNVPNAQSSFKKCQELRPNSGEALLLEAALYPYSKQALELIERAVYKDATLAEAYLEKGILCRYFGDNGRAVESYERYMELAGDYSDAFVLSELALACYKDTGVAHEKYKQYFTRWLYHFNKQCKLLDEKDKGNLYLIVDIGYDYFDFVVVTMDKDNKIIVYFNEDEVFGIDNGCAYQGGIGLCCSITNLNLLTMNYLCKKYSENGAKRIEENIKKLSKSEKQKLKEDAALPSLFRIADREEDFVYLKDILLQQNVLRLNHEWEYFIDKENIDVYLQISLKMINAKVRIGGYMMDIFVPNPGEGLQAFRRRISQGSIYDEAAIVVYGPSEMFQIILKAEWIEIIYV